LSEHYYGRYLVVEFNPPHHNPPHYTERPDGVFVVRIRVSKDIIDAHRQACISDAKAAYERFLFGPEKKLTAPPV
jgi:hypothetical protein